MGATVRSPESLERVQGISSTYFPVWGLQLWQFQAQLMLMGLSQGALGCPGSLWHPSLLLSQTHSAPTVALDS